MKSDFGTFKEKILILSLKYPQVACQKRHATFFVLFSKKKSRDYFRHDSVVAPM